MTLNKLAALFVAIAVAIIIGLGVYIDHLKGTAGALALRVYNDSAALDTTRRVLLSKRDSIRILGDSLQAVTKLATQRKIDRDRLDQALGQQQAANVALGITIDRLQAHQVPTAAPVVVDAATGDRSGQFHVERPAWTADASVRLPAAGAGTLDLDVLVQPLHLGLRIGCQDANRDGVRPARVTATSATGVAVRVDSATTDPGVCQLQSAQRTRWYMAFRPTIVAGVGYSFSTDTANTIQARRSLFLGVSLWRWPK